MFNGKKILTILPARLGDTLFITPALAFLKKHCPDIQLGVIVLSDVSKAVLQNNPAIDVLYLNPEAQTVKALNSEYDMLLHIHHDEFVVALVTQFSLPRRVIQKHPQTLSTADYHLQFISDLLQVPVEPTDRHYHLYPTAQDIAIVEALLAKQASSKKLIGIHLGSSRIAKRGWRFWKPLTHKRVWPLNRTIALAKRILKQHPDIQFVVTGSGSEIILAKQFVKKVKGSFHLVSKTNVVQLYALMKHFIAFITPDTGALHVACAADIPLLAFFITEYVAPSKPYPEADFRRVLCKPSIEAILLDEAYFQFSQLMENQYEC